MCIDPGDYEYLSELLRDKCGLELGSERGYLLQARLTPLLQEMKLTTIAELVTLLKSSGCDKLCKSIVDRMTTNETLFFRDKVPFEFISTFLNELWLRKKQDKRIRIWSAACSTGQEPYSVAMTLLGLNLDFRDWDIQILATDICSDVLKRASDGLFSKFEVQRGVSPEMQERFFTQNGSGWKIKNEVRKLVEFKEFNFMDPFTSMEKFDLILCRNVLIYFSPEMKAQILESLSSQLNKEGVLLLGATESIIGLSHIYGRHDYNGMPIYLKKAIL